MLQCGKGEQQCPLDLKFYNAYEKKSALHSSRFCRERETVNSKSDRNFILRKQIEWKQGEVSHKRTRSNYPIQ